MDIEGFNHGNSVKRESWKTVLTLAYQSLGVVYGDLSSSPLYVFKSTFAEDIQHSESNEEIYGALSFIFWTLTLIPLLKYVFIVLRATDNGEGGTFALYSLLCRHARLSTLPNCQLADEELSEYKNDYHNKNLGLRIRSTLEKHKVIQKLLLFLALVGTCMVIGDGVLTPAISVFSAVSGLELSMSKDHHQYVELPVTCVILVFLFALQHYGTHRVGFLFAPIVILWLACISSIGVYNIFHWNPHVYQALSPYYMYKFLKKTQGDGWKSLGGILLCITGSEAMFADLGHFSQSSIKIAFTLVVYPSLILAYMGQAAYLSKHHMIENYYQIGFYVSVPEKIRWPVLGIAILAAVVGSQAIITGTFSIVKQCSALGCFPNVKIVHTSSKIHGQIYIPSINWTLMLLCLAVTIGFRNTKHISNAAGLAVITVMLVTTCLMSLVIVLCWHKNILLALCFMLFFGSIEAFYFSASLMKFLDGAWVPIALSLIFLLIMYVWHYGTLKKYEFDVQNKVSMNWLLSLGPDLGIVRVRGIGLIHTELVSGVPAIFSHFVTNLPAFHQVLIFLCVKSVPVPHVAPDERFLVGRVGPKEYRLYRCIARYGYRDVHKDDGEFENDLFFSIVEFIRSEKPEHGEERSDLDDDGRMAVIGASSGNLEYFCEGDDVFTEVEDIEILEEKSPEVPRKRVRFVVPESPRIDISTRDELQELMEAREAGMAFILGHSYVKAKKGSSLIKRFVINFGYDFLRKNFCRPAYALSLPHASTLEVEWEPIRDGDQVKFKTRYGNYLRANGGLPPWRNSITHDIPLRHTDWILWDIDLVEKKPDYPEEPTFSESPAKSDHTPSPDTHSSHFHFNSPKFLKALGSFSNSPKKSDGRMIYYTIHDDNADAGEETSFVFKGNGLEELIIKLEEETGVEDIILCSRNKMNGKLFPLRLALPPNNASMHVVLVPPTSELARDFAGSPTTT